MTQDETSAAITEIIPGARGRRALTIALATVIVVLALLLAGGVVLVTKARQGEVEIPGITLTAADDPGVGAFTEPVVAGTPSGLSTVQLSAQLGVPDQGTVLVNGTDAGLYATTGSAACDTPGLGRLLTADQALGTAWGGVFGIRSESIPYYLDTLSPVLLTTDTWVTDHRYLDGSARPHQAILQTGTAVLVDAIGVPRVRCIGGSPLAPPADAPVGGYEVNGDRWPEYNTRKVTRVTYQERRVPAAPRPAGGVVTPAPAPAPAPGFLPTLQVLDLLHHTLVPHRVGGTLDLRRQPLLREPLPTPAALNRPYVPANADDARQNGLARPGSPAPAPDVTKRADEQRGIPRNAPDAAERSAEPVPADLLTPPRAPHQPRPADRGGQSPSATSTTAPRPSTQQPSTQRPAGPPAEPSPPASPATPTATPPQRSVAPEVPATTGRPTPPQASPTSPQASPTPESPASPQPPATVEPPAPRERPAAPPTTITKPAPVIPRVIPKPQPQPEPEPEPTTVTTTPAA
ncbi:hypothetical protein QSJ18_01560 [Gordonia sp. ABSL1-1]|uniref:DUF6777 domain-containing protein n=1 Tax=Gordonia sp. ABSL1-1 TaxID=3053923 RepID=UPI002572B78A|nr:DUF6777 domain-containing protein [Gordonia sp. ABSL1-1]MDL9935424.1 hypothetical protein [Gordonia sp. ABSL1-1]